MKYKVTGTAYKKDGSHHPFRMSIEANSEVAAGNAAIANLAEIDEKPKPGSVKVVEWTKSKNNKFKKKPIISSTKFCVFHNDPHPIADFGRNKISKDGYNNICKEGARELRRMRREGKNVEAYLTRPKGKMLEQMNEPLQPPRKHLIDGQLYINIDDLLNIIRRPR